MNQETDSNARLWLRISGLLLGIVILIWLPIEEQEVMGVVIISVAICIWAALWILVKPVKSNKKIILRHSLVGISAGLAVAPIAILLMALKSGIHGHGTPDFTVAQMQAVLTRTPFFALSGLLVGLGSGLYRLARENQQTEGG